MYQKFLNICIKNNGFSVGEPWELEVSPVNFWCKSDDEKIYKK